MKYSLLLLCLVLGCSVPSSTIQNPSQVVTISDNQLWSEFSALKGASPNPHWFMSRTPGDPDPYTYSDTHKIYLGQVVTFEQYKTLRISGH